MTTTILVVDDEPLLRSSLATLFTDEGFAVETAEDGCEALIRHQRQPADVILTDVVMPLVDGYELVDELRERGDHTPVVLMSVGGRPVAEAPNVRCLAKPFGLEELLETVDDLLTGAAGDWQ